MQMFIAEISNPIDKTCFREFLEERFRCGFELQSYVCLCWEKDIAATIETRPEGDGVRQFPPIVSLVMHFAGSIKAARSDGSNPSRRRIRATLKIEHIKLPSLRTCARLAAFQIQIGETMKKLYVGNLSYGANEETIRALFESHGAVESVNLITDRDTGRSKGFGFVEMTNDADAQRAIKALNGKEIDGRALTVNEARPKEDRPSGGGGRRSRW